MVFLYIFTTFLTMIYLLYLLKNLKENIIMLIFTLIYSLVFFLVPSLKFILNDYYQNYILNISVSYNSNILMHIYIFSLLFFLLILIPYEIISKTGTINIKTIKNNYSVPYKRYISYIIFILTFLGGTGVIFFSGMSISELLSAGRFTYWDTVNTPYRLVSMYLQYPFILVVYWYAKGMISDLRYIKYTFWITSSYLIFANLILFGSRTLIIAYVLAYVLGKAITNANRVKLIIIIPLVLLSFHVFVSWQYIRYNQSNMDAVSDYIIALLQLKDIYQLSLTQGDLTYFYDITYTAFILFPNQYEFLMGDSYIRLALILFPSFILPFKPIETQNYYGSLIYPNLQGVSMPPSILGDSYINFGFYGLIIAIVICFVILIYQGIVNQKRYGIIGDVLISHYPLLIILMIRGTFNGVYPMIFTILLIILINFIFKVLPKKVIT